MASHGEVEYATAEGNDYREHEATYEGFVRTAFVGIMFVATIVVGLAIGATSERWFVTFVVILFATIAALHGLLTGSKISGPAMFALSLATLGLVG
jgi:hypothetical protein